MTDNGNSQPLRSVKIALQDSNGPIDHLQIEETASGALRIAGWSQGQMLTHPLDVNEDELIRLIQRAVRARVLSDEFLAKLKDDFEI